MFSDSYKMKLVSEVMYEVFGKLETRKLGDIQLVTKLGDTKNMYAKNSTFFIRPDPIPRLRRQKKEPMTLSNQELILF